MSPTEIVIPVLPRGGSTDRRAGLQGSLATASESAARSISKRIMHVALDEESLARTVTAAISIAKSIQERVTPDSKFELSELEISLGVSATGKVGFIGTGLDVECEASFSVVLRHEV